MTPQTELVFRPFFISGAHDYDGAILTGPGILKCAHVVTAPGVGYRLRLWDGISGTGNVIWFGDESSGSSPQMSDLWITFDVGLYCQSMSGAPNAGWLFVAARLS